MVIVSAPPEWSGSWSPCSRKIPCRTKTCACCANADARCPLQSALPRASTKAPGSAQQNNRGIPNLGLQPLQTRRPPESHELALVLGRCSRWRRRSTPSLATRSDIRGSAIGARPASAGHGCARSECDAAQARRIFALVAETKTRPEMRMEDQEQVEKPPVDSKGRSLSLAGLAFQQPRFLHHQVVSG